MGLIDDIKTFLVALALGVVLTLAINFVVVNYTDGPQPAQASVQPAYDHDDDDASYEAPKPVQKTDTSSSSFGTYY